MSSGTKTTADYIQHHLTNLTYGQLPDGSWGFAHSGAEAAQMGFWSVNVDSMAWSIALGLVFACVFRAAAASATSGVPGGLQNFVEMIVEFIDETTQSIFQYKNDLNSAACDDNFCLGVFDESDGLGARGLDSGAGGCAGHITYEDRALHRPQHHDGYGALGVCAHPLLQHQVQRCDCPVKS